VVLASLSGSVVSGVVVSQDTGEPVAGAMVYVHSAMPYEEDGLSSYARTDDKGNFKAQTRGTINALRAWKPGYALRKVPVDDFPTLLSKAVIRLRPLTPTNGVMENDTFLYEFKSGGGFSFALGRRLSPDDPQADIAIAQEADGTIYVEALGDG